MGFYTIINVFCGNVGSVPTDRMLESEKYQYTLTTAFLVDCARPKQ